jgi:hypothetical protein
MALPVARLLIICLFLSRLSLPASMECLYICIDSTRHFIAAVSSTNHFIAELDGYRKKMNLGTKNSMPKIFDSALKWLGDETAKRRRCSSYLIYYIYK